MPKKILKVKTARGLKPDEALALLQTAVSRIGGVLEHIKTEIFTRTSKGDHYGLVVPEWSGSDKISEKEKARTATSINQDFRKRNFAYRVRYVPSHDGLVFAPQKAVEDAFGK